MFTTNTINRVLPIKFQDQLNNYIGEELLQITEKENIEKIKEFLEFEKVSAQAQCQVTGGQNREPQRTGQVNVTNQDGRYRDRAT